MTDETEKKILQLRKTLHEHAELSGNEVETRRILKEFLSNNTGLEIRDCGNWFYAKYRGDGAGEWVALRADFDALLSKDGTAKHLCGHDGHSAALCYTGMLLEQKKVRRNVILLFQPSEEDGKGAAQCVSLFQKENVREIYGCHNLPGFPFGKVYTSEDTFALASRGIALRFTGAPAHAAYPEDGISPALLIGKLLERISEWNAEGKEQLCFATVIGADIGSHSYGVAADRGELRVTARAKTDAELFALEQKMVKYAKDGAQEAGLKFSMEILDPFPATVNDPECAEKILRSCGAELLKEPMRWSEDFGTFLLHKKGAFFGIGAGENCPGLHTENYEYPDELLRFTANAFISIVTVK